MRAFVAVEISNANVINSIKSIQSDIITDEMRKLENYHFTLQFLGEISNSLSQDVITALRTIKFSKFNIGLKKVGVFPNSRWPRAIWIGTDDNSRDQLICLIKKVNSVLGPLGLLADKRSYSPHVTIFRIKKKFEHATKVLDSKKALEFGVEEVTKIKLKKSTLTPSGAIYSDLGEIKAIK